MGHSTGLAVLGSTGSIGRQTLDIVRSLAPRFRVVGLAAGRNVDLLGRQIEEFHPELVYCDSGESLPGAGFRRLPLEEIANHPSVDTVVVATSGKAGLSATLAAAKAGKTIALANKESLVMAGALVTREARQSGARILPVDSEHSAIWQCLAGETGRASAIILTASGGPFRGFTPDRLAEVTPELALRHPSWRMGP